MKEKLNFRYMGEALVRSARAYRHYKSRSGLLAAALRKWARLRHIFWSILTSSDIDPQAQIGERLRLPHPQGVIVHGSAVIGNDCLVMQQVTIGMLTVGDAPVIGSRVFIGAGAKILGKIVVGDGARIGASAVVLCDVPAGWTAVGVPARLVQSHPDLSSCSGSCSDPLLYGQTKSRDSSLPSIGLPKGLPTLHL
jgi:serine O-acetyltransferase